MRDEERDDVLEHLRRRIDARPRRVRRLVGIELVAAEDVLDAIDAEKDGVARVGAVAEARLEMRGDGESVLMRARDKLGEMLGRDPFRLEGARALRGPVVDVAIDVGGSRILIPAAPRGAEIRPRVVEARSDLLTVVDAFARGHHAVGVVLARGERRRDSVREEDERVIRPLIAAQAVGTERHVVVRMNVENAGQYVLVVAQLNDARALRFVGGDRSIHREQSSGDDENSLIAHDGVRGAREEPAAANDDRILSEGGDPRGVLRRVLRRRERRQSGGQSDDCQRVA